MRGLVALAVASSILMSGCEIGAERKDPALRMTRVLAKPPGPHDTSLHLVTSDIEGCSGADHEVVDVGVEETETEIVVDAGLIVVKALPCEIRFVQEEFRVELDRPLGRRLVVDNSRGRRSVIWSPRMRRAVLQRLRVNRADAESFIRSKFPGGEDVRCDTFRPVLFLCRLRAPSPHKRELLIYVDVRPGADLKAQPERMLSPDLRRALRNGRR